MKVHLHHVGGRGEGTLGRWRVAEGSVDDQIVGRFVPYRWRTARERVLCLRDSSERLVFDLDRFRAIECLVMRARHDHGDRLAHMARLVGRQKKMRPVEEGPARGRGEPHVELGRRHRCVVDRPEPVCGAVGACEHAQHAGCSHRPVGGNLRHARMCVRRAHHHRMELSCELQRPTHSGWRIADPEVTGVRRIERDVDLCRLQCELADLCRKQITAANRQLVLLSPHIQPVEPENVVAAVKRSFR